MDLSQGQKEVVSLLLFNSRYKMEINEIVYRLNANNVHIEWTYDRVYAMLRRLEKREIVVKTDNPSRWQLTTKARNHIKKEGILT